MTQSEMMAVAITAPGGPEVLEVQRADIPDIADNDVLIRVAAAGVNGPDLAQRRGLYDPPPGHSGIPGLEVSGEIVGRGEKVDHFHIGDHVVALCNGGGYAEFVAVPAAQVLPLPRGWSLIAGATLPETFFTVQQTLVMRAGLSSGMTVLIHGGAGGIGGTAIQICKLYGARPIAVVSGPEKAAYARELGASDVIDHTAEDFVERTGTLTDGRGADRIIEIMGGDTLPRSLAVVARGGHIVLLAALKGARSEINVGLMLSKQLTVSGSTLRPQTPAVKAEIAQRLLEDIWSAIEDGRIVPPGITEFALADAAAAHRALEQRTSFGKFVLVTKFGTSV